LLIALTPICLFSWLAIAFLPTTKQACAIYVIPRIVNNKEVQELPEKVVDLANEWLEELKPKKKEQIE